MHWLSSFALLLYLSLLCTPQAFAVHDERLSPLADTQFHAVTPEIPQCTSGAEQDITDDPLAALPITICNSVSLANTCSLERTISANSSLCLTLQQARAPPQSASY